MGKEGIIVCQGMLLIIVIYTSLAMKFTRPTNEWMSVGLVGVGNLVIAATMELSTQ